MNLLRWLLAAQGPFVVAARKTALHDHPGLPTIFCPPHTACPAPPENASDKPQQIRIELKSKPRS